MTTTSYNKAKTRLYMVERTSIVTITWKEFDGVELVTRKRDMKAWEALNLIENINKLAFVKLAI